MWDHIFDKATPYVDEYGYTTVNCADMDKLPVIEILYGGYWLEMIPEDYLIYDDWSDTCWICIDESYDDMWILGDSFMRGYYSTHDHTE